MWKNNIYTKGQIIAQRYEVVGEFGAGGNGEVYKVKDLKNPSEMLAIKVVKLNINAYYNKNNKYHNSNYIKYQRFKDEIKIVRSNQDTINGILPILDMNIPKYPQVDNLPWYVMPIAEPMLEKIEELDIGERVKVVLDLCKVLVQLHSKNIAHRDIKPQNIYFYEKKWVISDFGLVYYPKKNNLTRINESVGPKRTIAPEMKRNPKNSDPLLADVYSMAKTLWMVLTNELKGFDGQYNHKSKLISLSSYLKNKYLVTLHELLTMATSEIPEQRPNIKIVVTLLESWFVECDDWTKRTQKEWDFIIKDIIPYKPETVVWTDYKEISNVLDIVSRTESLNHMFLPSGGGMDFIGCEISKRDGFIELNEDGFIKLVKPKRLYMEIMGEYQWNYFLLETEEIQPSGVYNHLPEELENIYYERVVELEQEVYIDPSYMNYGVYNGKKLPNTAREIFIGLKGSYVIFPKNSIYNLEMNSYRAYQTQYNTPEKFKNFILETINYIKWIKENPEERNRILKEKEKKKQEERSIYREKFKKEKQILLERLKTFKVDSDYCIVSDNDSMFVYYIESYIAGVINFYLDANKELSIKVDSFKVGSLNLEGLVDTLESNKKKMKKYLLFNTLISAKQMVEHINDFIINCTKDLETINFHSGCSIESFRIKRPQHLFTREELQSVLTEGDDSKHNQVVIDGNGYVQLIDRINYNYIEKCIYPVLGDEFSPGDNMVGSLAKVENYADHVYVGLLNSWHRHLSSGKRRRLSDYWDDNSELELIKSIQETIKQYD